jgi:hypothetical protein
MGKRYTGGKGTVKLFVDAVHSRRGRARRGSVFCKHGFLCHVSRCYGDEPQILYELHNFGTGWVKVRNVLVRRLCSFDRVSHQVDRDVVEGRGIAPWQTLPPSVHE